MPKLNLSPAFIAARRGTTQEFREVGVPLYAPAPGEYHPYALPTDDGVDEDVVDASGITIGGDDDIDDDFY